MRTNRRSNLDQSRAAAIAAVMMLGCLCLPVLPVMAQEGQADEGVVEEGTPEESVNVEESAAAVDGEEDSPWKESAESGVEESVTLEGAEGEEETFEEDERYVADNINLDGGVGFHKITSAAPGSAKMFRAAFLGEFYTGADTVRINDENTRTVGRVLLQGTLTDYLALNFGLMAKSNVNSYGQPQAMLTQGDANLGLLGFYPVANGVTLGLDVNLFVPATFGSAGLDLSAISVRPRLLATLETGKMTEGRVPLDVHFNVGYLVDRSDAGLPENINNTDVTRIERFAYNISAYDLVELGVGAEYDLPYIKPFIGYWMGIPVNEDEAFCGRTSAEAGIECASEAGLGAAPKLLSLGAKVEPVENLGLHAGVDIGLTTNDAAGLPATAPYNIVFGLSWTIDPTPKVEYVEVEKVIEKEKIIKEALDKGFIVGTIVDEKTNDTVRRATIEYVGEQVSAQASSDVNGSFRSYGFEPGKELKMRVTHPDYEPLEVTAQVQEGETPLNIALKALPKIGTLKGRVLDEKDKPVKVARVTISSDKGKSVSVPVDGGGNFTTELKAGSYTIAVTAEDYLTRGRDVVLEADDTVAVDIVLLPKPKKELAQLTDTRIEILDAVYFDTGEATIQQRSFGLLNQVASILLENPQIRKIQVEGHTDDRGAKDFNMDLSQRRADAVRQFLIDQGISPDRLVGKGFGPTRPILPNTSDRNRALNRRVEFNILEQPAAKPAASDTSAP